MQVVGGHWAGGWWTFGAAYYILWLGLMDHAFGEDNDPPPPRYRKPQPPKPSGRWGQLLGDDQGFGVLLYGWVVAQLGLVAWGCGAVRGLTFTEQARPPCPLQTQAKLIALCAGWLQPECRDLHGDDGALGLALADAPRRHPRPPRRRARPHVLPRHVRTTPSLPRRLEQKAC